MVNSVNTTLVLQDQLQGYILLYFYNFLRALSLFRMLVEFSLIFVLFHHVWEKFSIYGVHIPRKSIESAPPPQSKLSPKFLSSHPRQKEITHSLRQYFFKNLFPPTGRKECRKLWFAFSEFNQEIWRWLETLGYLYFVWFVIFSNLMVLQFRK